MNTNVSNPNTTVITNPPDYLKLLRDVHELHLDNFLILGLSGIVIAATIGTVGWYRISNLEWELNYIKKNMIDKVVVAKLEADVEYLKKIARER